MTTSETERARGSPETESASRGPRIDWWPPAVVALVLLVIAGLPLFLCRGQTLDSTFYDVCAQMARDGKHVYQELFLHGPPGMIWAYSIVRGLVGWRVESLRAVDITIVALSLALVVRLGLGPRSSVGARLWLAAILLGFYFSTTEWSQCETDVWMLLPATAALCLRVRQVEALTQVRFSRIAAGGIVEGVLWGVAFVMKPHVIIPAACAWLASAAVNRVRGTPWRLLFLDFSAVVAGGILVGIATVAWLVGSGNWQGFQGAVFSSWNRDYLEQRASLARRLVRMLEMLWPWSLIQLAAVPAAIHAIWLATGRDEACPDRARRCVAGAAYLGFFVEANFLQHQFAYHLVPVVFLGAALLAGATELRWFAAVGLVVWLALAILIPRLARVPAAEQFAGDELWYMIWPAIVIVCCLVAGDRSMRVAALAAAMAWLVWHHPLRDPIKGQQVRQAWVDVWHDGSTLAVRNLLNEEEDSAPDWIELQDVARFLKTVSVRDRELLCYCPSAMPLYTELHVQPATRFALLWSALGYFHRHWQEIGQELSASQMRFVVNDLRLTGITKTEAKAEFPTGRLPRPDELRVDLRKKFPWTEPLVFRAGRYVVHQVRPRETRGTAPLKLWYLRDETKPSKGTTHGP